MSKFLNILAFIVFPYMVLISGIFFGYGLAQLEIGKPNTIYLIMSIVFFIISCIGEVLVMNIKRETKNGE